MDEEPPLDAHSGGSDIMNDTCENCAAFCREDEADFGRCRRESPSQLMGSWPLVKETDWCLKHVPRVTNEKPKQEVVLIDVGPMERARALLEFWTDDVRTRLSPSPYQSIGLDLARILLPEKRFPHWDAVQNFLCYDPAPPPED